MFRSRHFLKQQQRIVWMLLFAVVFSALSPALAVLRFQSQPQILAELCTMHGIERVATDANADANANGTNEEAPASHDHGIFCAWCMPASTQQAITTLAVPAVALVHSKHVQPFSEEKAVAFSAPFVSYQSQAPPALS